MNHKIGEVHDGAATMDWMEQEQERGITITSAATTCFWKGMDLSYPEHHINIIDTPGTRRLHHRSRALACACSTARAWCTTPSAACSRSPRRCGARRTSTACRGSRSSTRWTASAPTSSSPTTTSATRLKGNPVPIQIPIGAEDKFDGVIDLVTHAGDLLGRGHPGHEVREASRSRPSSRAEAKEWRDKMVEAAAEANEELMNKYLESNELSVEEIKQGLRLRTINNEIVPMLCGSAFKNKGVQAMLDAVIDYLPSPIDIPPVKGENENGEPDSAQAERRGAVRRPRVQDHDRPVRRPADVHPRVLGRAELGRHGLHLGARHARSASAACCRCTPTSARKSRKCAPATSPPWSA